MQQNGCVEPFLDPLLVNSSLKNNQLITSAEFSLKKTLPLLDNVEGIFAINSCFRQEEPSGLHAQEFFMLEYYLNDFDYLDQAKFFLELLKSVNTKYFLEGSKLPSISFHRWFFEVSKTSWPQGENMWKGEQHLEYYLDQCFTVLKKVLNLKENKFLLLDMPQKEQLVIEHLSVFLDIHIEVYAHKNFENQFWCLYDFPIILQGMSMSNYSNYTCKRLEVYFGNIEIGNAYQEIYDKHELEKIWVKNNRIRKGMNKLPHKIDYELLQQTHLMKKVSGMAIGVERLAMVLFGITSIDKFQI